MLEENFDFDGIAALVVGVALEAIPPGGKTILPSLSSVGAFTAAPPAANDHQSFPVFGFQQARNFSTAALPECLAPAFPPELVSLDLSPLVLLVPIGRASCRERVCQSV